MTAVGPNRLFRNDDGKFVDITESAGVAGATGDWGSSTGWFDSDNDGDLDILVANIDAAPNLLRNDSQAHGNWLSLRLRSGDSNREGVGARIYLQTEDGRQMREVRTGTSFQSQNDMRQHFGLAKASLADITVQWTDGTEQHYASVAANQFYTIAKEAYKITVE